MITAAITSSSSPIGDRRIADRQARELQHAGDAGERGRQRVDEDLGRDDGDAAQPRGPLVRADREQVPAERV